MKRLLAITVLVLVISAPVPTASADSPPAPRPRVHSPPPAGDTRPVPAPTILRPVAPYLSIVDGESQAHGIPASLVVTLILVESDGDARALSGEGAQGLMQLEPGTLHWICASCDPWRPEDNIRAGVLYLRWLASYYHISEGCLSEGPGGDADCAWRTDEMLSGYNAGVAGSYASGYVAAVRKLWPEVKGEMAS